MPSNLISFSVDILVSLVTPSGQLDSGGPIKKGLRYSGALKLLTPVLGNRLRRGHEAAQKRSKGDGNSGICEPIPLSVPRPLRTALYSLYG
jgi:hypothetical protein